MFTLISSLMNRLSLLLLAFDSLLTKSLTDCTMIMIRPGRISGYGVLLEKYIFWECLLYCKPAPAVLGQNALTVKAYLHHNSVMESSMCLSRGLGGKAAAW